ncbi:MAG: selenium-dependent molybdenum cofactor biosynthesis protein YqeB [Lachnospirales bacterium]
MLIVVRGGGDLATGTIHRLWSAGFKVVVFECENPSAIRRQVSVCEAVYDGVAEVEGMKCVKICDLKEIGEIHKNNDVPLLVDSNCTLLSKIKADILIDAIIAKKNLGTNKNMAPLTIALGPGFNAGVDVDIVIETKRGHNLGRIIKSGFAYPNSGIPGNIGGFTKERVIHSPGEGVIRNLSKIGDKVNKGDDIAYVVTKNGMVSVKASISGILRGIIRECYYVKEGLKIADIDPREEEYSNCFTISDKARCIAGSVLECVCKYERENK